MKKRFSYIWLGSLFLIGWVSDGGAPIGAVTLLVMLWLLAGMVGMEIYRREKENERQRKLDQCRMQARQKQIH